MVDCLSLPPPKGNLSTKYINERLYLAARNLPHVVEINVAAADPVSLVAFDKVLVTVSALRNFEH